MLNGQFVCFAVHMTNKLALVFWELCEVVNELKHRNTNIAVSEGETLIWKTSSQRRNDLTEHK